MKKKFVDWFKIKEILHEEKERPFFAVGEIWFCELGANVGFEQDGVGKKFLRPVLIIKKFNKEICLIVPLTKTKKDSKFYHSFTFAEKTSVAILSQVRLIDAKRLNYRAGVIAKDVVDDIKKHIINIIE